MKSEPNVSPDLAADAAGRDRIIVRTSLVGVLTNVLLAAFKGVVGILSHSIAITLDAVNNLSDVLSSVITIVGTKLAGRSPDRKHPLGHGRIEYLSAMIVSAVILYAGITAAIESVKKIIHPEEASYSTLTLVILAAAVLTKLVLGRYVKRQGRAVKSAALEASGTDALFDAFISLSVLASALLFLASGVSLEAYVGVVISIFILKAGVEILQDTLNDLIGHRADEATTREIRRILNEEPEVRGAYDLILNDYGPSRSYGSVHLELPDTMTVAEVDVLTRRVQARVYRETGVILTGVGVYSYNTGGGPAAEIRNRVQEAVLAHDWALQLHGFYLDLAEKDLRFDVVMSFDIDPQEGLSVLHREIQAMYPDYRLQIAPDVDVSD